MEVKVIKSKLLEPSDKFKRVEIKKRLECLEFPIIIRCITKHVNFELLDTRITAAIYFISFSYKKKDWTFEFISLHTLLLPPCKMRSFTRFEIADTDTDELS